MLLYQCRPEGGVFSSLLLSREKGGIRTSKWEPSGLSKRKVPLQNQGKDQTGQPVNTGCRRAAVQKHQLCPTLGLWLPSRSSPVAGTHPCTRAAQL